MTYYSPMLAKLCEQPFDDEELFYEPKLDGIRCQVEVNSSVTLRNRQGVDITYRFPDVVPHIHTNKPCILDGEMVCFDENEVPDFQLMQTRMGRVHNIEEVASRHPAAYVAFDILEIGGKPQLDVELWRRKRRMEKALIVEPKAPVWTIIHQRGGGLELLEHLGDAGWEGVMAKHIQSRYLPGRRTANWLKMKAIKHGVFDIIGATWGTGKRQGTFGALVLGLQAGDSYIHLGEVGTGFEDDYIIELNTLLETLKTDICPLGADSLKEIRQAVKMWVRPVLKAKVAYLELSNAGILRHPAFEELVVDG